MSEEKFQNKYRIPSARAGWWDYATSAAYFVTICTADKEHYFGEIENGEMQLSEIGQIANSYWLEIPQHFSFVILGEFVVMPNYVHGIIIIDKNDDVETPNLGVSTTGCETKTTGGKNDKWHAGTLGVIINQYKLFILFFLICHSLSAQKTVSQKVMQKIYEEVSTPYKYGLVVAPTDNKHKIDCPTVFRKNGRWYMSYLVYNGKSGKDGRGYETWLAESEDLLHWNTLGRIFSFPETGSGRWDENQRAGYIALIDYRWNGTYEPQKFNGKYWMSYFGGTGKGYEQDMLHEGMAFTEGDITKAHEWQTLDSPILSPLDSSKGWWENITQYKSFVMWDKKKTLGYPFVLYYNAGGINPANNVKAERIGIALSDDMLHWTRYPGNPVVNHEQGITGDGIIQKIGDIYVMFYFGAFHKNRPYKAFNTFACSRDLINWTDWDGADLIFPTEKYDNLFAHKSCVVKWNGIVYHFYCAVNEDDQRGIAVATSKDSGKSLIHFPKSDKEISRTEIPSQNN